MSGEIDLPLPDPGSLKRGRFTYFPVVPGRLEFAIEARQAIAAVHQLFHRHFKIAYDRIYPASLP